jgi:hypothetical protein
LRRLLAEFCSHSSMIERALRRMCASPLELGGAVHEHPDQRVALAGARLVRLHQGDRARRVLGRDGPSSGYQSTSRMVSVTNHALRYTAFGWWTCRKLRSQKLTALA